MELASPYTRLRMRPRKKTAKDFGDFPSQAQHIATE